MSYDLFGFDLDAVTNDEDLLPWFERQSEWSEPHTYRDAAVTTPALQGFYHQLAVEFPPLPGPGEPINDGDDTDYAIGAHIVYAAFRWSQQEHAALRAAAQHHVGLCEISENPVVVHRPTT